MDMEESSSSRRAYGTTNNAEDSDDESVAPPPTRKQKLIKAGCLFALFLIIVYVILDYTVSQRVKESTWQAGCKIKI